MGILLTGLMLVACGPDAIRIDIDFKRLSGLAEGDRVLFQDNPAGTVTSIAYRKDGTYRVGIEVDNGYEKALTEYSRFYTAADPTRSGSRVVIIELTRSGGRLLQDGVSVKGMDSPIAPFPNGVERWRRGWAISRSCSTNSGATLRESRKVTPIVS